MEQRPPVTNDPHRTVPARLVTDIDADGAQPGDVEALAIDGTVWGYGFACPGCGSKSFLALGGENPEPRWTVTAGDAAQPAGVTLSPSVFHTAARGGCGWHGWLRAGVFVPC
jgi:hypothetical protein